MRRKDREITDNSEIIKIIEKCDVCRIALSHDSMPYIIPLNFGYEYTEYITDEIASKHQLVLYFHCAKEGKKLDIIRLNNNACFEFDCSHKLLTGENAHNYTMEYESVIGNGKIEIIGDSDKDKKRKALSIIMKKYAPEKDFDFSEAYCKDEIINSVTILKLTATDFTGKRNIKN